MWGKLQNLMNEIKELNKWRHMFVNEKTQSCQDVLSYQLALRFNSIPIKVLASYLVNIHKLILKFVWRGKKPRMLKTNKVGGISRQWIYSVYDIIIMDRCCYTFVQTHTIVFSLAILVPAQCTGFATCLSKSKIFIRYILVYIKYV